MTDYAPFCNTIAPNKVLSMLGTFDQFAVPLDAPWPFTAKVSDSVCFVVALFGVFDAWH